MSALPSKPDAAGANVFISYSRRDLSFVDRLVDALKARSIVPVIDRSEIYAFETWWTRIEALIAAADTIVFVLSPDAIASPICNREVDHARKLGKRFAPIVCRSVADQMEKVPPALADLNFIFFDAPDHFEDALERLVEALSTDIDWVRAHTAFGLQAADWEKAARPRGLLLRSPRLEAAERWIASRPPSAPLPTSEVQAFVRESRAGATRRRNMLTSALAAGLLVAVGLAGIAFWQREAAISSERQAQAQKRKAEAAATAAESAARSLVFDFAQGIRDRPGMPQDLVDLVLGRADKILKELSETLPDDRNLLQLRAEGLLEIGETLEKKNSIDQAKYVYRVSRHLLEKLVAAYPDDVFKDDLAIALNRMGLLLLRANDIAGAHTSLQSAYAIRKAMLLRAPGDPARRLGVALDQQNLAAVKVKRNDMPSALSLYEEARRTMASLAEGEPANPRYLEALGTVDHEIGNIRRTTGDSEGALNAYRADNAIFAKLCAANRNNVRLNSNLGISHSSIGEILRLRGDLPAALQSFRTAQAILERVTIDSPDATAIQVSLAAVQTSIGDVLLKQQKYQDARLAFMAARSLLEDVRAKEPDDREALAALVAAHIKYGVVEEESLAADDAIRAYETSRSLLEPIIEREPAALDWQDKLAVTYDLVGNVKRNRRDIKGALEAFEASLAIRQRLSKRAPSNEQFKRGLLLTTIDIGDVLLRDGQRAKAKERADDAVDLAERLDRQRQTPESQDDLKRATALSRDVQADLDIPPRDR